MCLYILCVLRCPGDIVMELSILKKLRLNAGLTQKQVADAVGVSQPNYQRWESGASSVPEGKLKKLAKALGTTVDEIKGKAKPFDLFGVDDSIEDSRTYYGEVAVHFKSSSDSILLPVSEASRSRLYSQMTSTGNFLSLESLDNRTVYIRREAIADIYISSEAYDTYGPEEYEGNLGVYPDEDFWDIIESSEEPEFAEEIYGEDRVKEVLDSLFISDEQIHELVSKGDIKKEDFDEVKEKIKKEGRDFYDRATEINLQFVNGKKRSEYIYEDEEVYNVVCELDEEFDVLEEPIHLSIQGYHRSIFVLKNSIDYIVVPTHKFNKGALISMEEIVGEEIKPNLKLVD